jgi:aconitate hydratase
VRYTIERDGLLNAFEKIGGRCWPMPAARASASGRATADKKRRTPSSTPSTATSPSAQRRQPQHPRLRGLAGDGDGARAQRRPHLQSRCTDTLINDKGEQVKLDPNPRASNCPKGFAVRGRRLPGPAAEDGSGVEVVVKPDSSACSCSNLSRRLERQEHLRCC